jgi:hypothetical protein
MSTCHAAISTPLTIFINYGTLLSPELERLTLPESIEGGSLLSVLVERIKLKIFKFRFPILPPLVRQEDPEGLRLGKLEAERRLSRVLPEVTERTLDSMLRELRTVDRDRDRILPASQISQIVKKYQVAVFDNDFGAERLLELQL